MRWLFDLVRRLPGGSVKISWTWEIGSKPRGIVRKNPFASLLEDFFPKAVTKRDNFFAAETHHEEPMSFPDTYPKADQRFNGQMKVGGSFLNGLPQGVTVHYTADRDLDRTVRALVARELGYHLLITRDGTVHQCAPLTKTMWHAGRAVWGLLSPNKTHVAISIVSWGEVEQLAPGAYEAWNGSIVPTKEVEQRQGDRYWDIATPEQEASLVDALVWLCGKGIDWTQICGHDECALPKGRKSDPGGVIQMTMEQLRYAVASKIEAAV